MSDLPPTEADVDAAFNATAWALREPRAVWRGTTTGVAGGRVVKGRCRRQQADVACSRCVKCCWCPFISSTFHCHFIIVRFIHSFHRHFIIDCSRQRWRPRLTLLFHGPPGCAGVTNTPDNFKTTPRARAVAMCQARTDLCDAGFVGESYPSQHRQRRVIVVQQ